ncbi:hypothetical protein BH10ACI2_BH10ACI2_00170 [soil metagenome]
MNQEPIITALPTTEEFNLMADKLVPVEAGYNDEQAKALIDIMLTLADPENDHVMHLANTTARHVFAKTEAAEAAFREFAGYPDRPGYNADRYVIHAAGHQN